VTKLVRALKHKVPGAVVEVETHPGFGGDHYTVAVLSDRFEKLGWTEMHKPLWDVAFETLTDEQRMKVATVAVRPSDLNGAEG
jgi:hypothetical protein